MTWEPLLDFRNEKIRTLLGRNKENELQDLEDVAVKSQNPIDLHTKLRLRKLKRRLFWNRLCGFIDENKKRIRKLSLTNRAYKYLLTYVVVTALNV